MARRNAERRERVSRGTGNMFADLGFSDAAERQAKLRLASTAATLGHANPLVSLAEHMGAIVLTVTAILLPLLALLVLAAIVLAIASRRERRSRA